MDSEHAALHGRRGPRAEAWRRDGHHTARGDPCDPGDPAAQTGWLGALRDQQIGRAIALVHRDPARNWTVASLAMAVGMSRSAFAARFSQLVGEPAVRYVTRWKMHAALMWLKEENAALREIASRLGYESEAAFSRAFKISRR
jgi:AraC-like DNA-binding protein